MLKLYRDLLANVRYDGGYHSIRSLVQPDDPTVKEVARVLVQAPDFVAACQEFVNSFTTYVHEEGDFWSLPGETLEERAGDCDCKSILLLSLLRNYIPPEQVFCAVGDHRNGKVEGHMWVVMGTPEGWDRIIEATAGPNDPPEGDQAYDLMAIFNDRYAFS